MTKRKYALFIDGDNIPSKYLHSILREVDKEGDIQIKRIYGDWSTPNMNSWKATLAEYPIRPVQQFRNGDNATDNCIIMDAIEVAINAQRGVDAICIVSTDVDFYSLALRLREYGLYVLGIGAKKANKLWVQSCSEFKFIENFAQDEEIKISAKDPIEKVIAWAYRNAPIAEDGWVSFSAIGTTLRNFDSSFDFRTYGFKALGEVIESLSDVYRVRHDDRTPRNYWLKDKHTERQQKAGSKRGSKSPQ